LRAAVDGARAIERPALAWRAQLVHGQFLHMQGRRTEADVMLASARDIVKSLAATVPDATLRQNFLTSATTLLAHAQQPPTGRAATARPRYPAGLSAREVEVLGLVAEGLTDAEVAARLFLSPRTISQHLRSIYNKLGVNTRTAAARFAVEHGLT
jgi:DNA-binding NarL/FixJ family response regulator